LHNPHSPRDLPSLRSATSLPACGGHCKAQKRKTSEASFAVFLFVLCGG